MNVYPSNPRSNLASRQRAAMTKPTARKGPASKASTATTSASTKKPETHRRQAPTNGRAVTANKDGKKTANGATASGDAVTKEEETKEEEQQPLEEEKKFEPSTHMEADLVETLGIRTVNVWTIYC